MPCVAAQPRNLEAHKSGIMALFVQCTKVDVTLNNYITRSKCPEQLNLFVCASFSRPQLYRLHI